MADAATATIVDALYALPPEDFTAARDAAAKQARDDGDREAATALKALRRPSVAAWLVNRLASEQAGLLEQLLSLGPALAAAQSGGQADELRALGRQRRELVEAVADAAATGSGRPVSSAVREEVVSTLEAALADPSSAEAVRSGRLVRGLSYAGFGGVDLSGAVAVAPAARGSAVESPAKGKAESSAKGKAESPAKGKAKQDRLGQERAARREAVAAAERAAQEAAGRLDDAVRAAERAQREAADRTAAQTATEEQVAEARAALEAAERRHTQAVEAADAAVEAARAAVDTVREAQDQAERARQELDRLRRDASPACTSP